MSHLTRAIRFVRHWHARAGVLAALFFLFLAATGVALNHTDALQLASKQVGAGWLMHWYGVKSEAPAQGYLFEQGYFVGNREHWVMDGRDLPPSPEPVLGAAEVAGMRYLATASMIHIYLPDGSLVDRLTGSALPAAPVSRLGQKDGTLLVQTPQGIFVSEDGLDWRPDAAEGVTWSQPQPLPADVGARVAAHFAPSLPLERVLLDVHSGRIFGRYGPLAMDLAALALAALALSGIWIYLRTIRRKP